LKMKLVLALEAKSISSIGGSASPRLAYYV